MFEERNFVDDADRRIHDEVFIQSIDRRERITRILVTNLGIDDTSARDEEVASDVLCQLLREENPIAEDIFEDLIIFISELDESSYTPEAVRGSGRANGFYDRAKAKQYIDTYWKK